MSEHRKANTSVSLFLSTALHGSVIALIALGPSFIPGMVGKGDRDSKNIEFEVSDSAVPAMTTPVAEPTPAPVAVKKVAKPVVAKLPEKAPEKIVEPQPAVVIEEPVTPTEVVEESPVVAAAPVEEAPAPAPEPEPVAEEPVVAPVEEKVAAVEEAPAPVAQPVAEPVAEKVATATAPAAAPVTQAEAGTNNEKTAGSPGDDKPIQITQNYTGLRQLPGNKPPAYTRDMRLKKLQGRGQLVYYVNKSGAIEDIRLSKSTGSKVLDQEAVAAFKKYKFVPGQEGYTKHDFEFSLTGPGQSDTGRLRTTMTR